MTLRSVFLKQMASIATLPFPVTKKESTQALHSDRATSPNFDLLETPPTAPPEHFFHLFWLFFRIPMTHIIPVPPYYSPADIADVVHSLIVLTAIAFDDYFPP